jgi:RNA polymerase sigma-70 factor, ECF subfamily
VEYDRLVARHKDAVYRQMVRVCGNYDDAEDVLTDALLAAHRAKDTIRDDGAFQAWLSTAARRVCYRLKKREALRPRLLPLEDLDLATPAPSAHEEAEQAAVKRCIQGALDGLPPEYREVYALRELEGISGEEVASRLGISVPAMKSRLNRAREKVRAALDAAMFGAG